MSINPIGGRMRVYSPAKLNLILRVLGRRSDGYHDLLLFNTGIDLADEVVIELSGDGIRFKCEHPLVPGGDANLCVRAARAFFQAAPEHDTGVTIRLVKRIPVAAGLGGGSSNAAAVLWGLNRITRAGLPEERLRELGKGLGADVPFFLYQSPAWAEGIGEVLSPGPFLPDPRLLLAGFDFGVSAGRAFGEWNLTTAASCDILIKPKKEKILPAPEDWHNDLEAVVTRLHPEIGRVKNEMISAGARTALMSGSGPSVFGVFPHRESREEARGRLEKMEGIRVFVVNVVHGSLLRQLD